MNTLTLTQRDSRMPTSYVDGHIHRPHRLFCLLAVGASLAFAPLQMNAQAKAPVGTATSPAEKPIVVETKAPDLNEEVLTLDTFQVNAEKDDGFMATNAGTATKLGLDMKDMSAPYSVMTGEFIKAMGITDLQSAVMWSTNGAPVLDGQGADLFGGGGTSTTSNMYNIRGAVLNAGQQRNFFLTAGIGDTYNVERIDFGRGPNAVLFNVGANDALGGGISMTGKRPRLDRDANTLAVTAGSYDYYRSTLDVNKILIPGKLGMRANLLYQKKKGWMDQEFEDRQGFTLSFLYRLGKKSDLQVEAIYDKISRSRVPLPYFDNLSGWNGSTVFNGPVTSDQINGLAPLANGTFLSRGPSSPTNSTIVAYTGQPEGVSRENGNVYIFDPASNTVMNWINTGTTRRGDETPLVPIYIDGVAWSRNNNGEMLAIGNGGSAGAGNKTPGNNSAGGGQAAFYDMINLPGDIFSRQIANSHFTVPGKQFSAMPKQPLFVQPTKDFNFAFRHQAGDQLYFELSGDANRVVEQSLASYLNFRIGLIDINQTLPTGQPNPHFLDPYSQSDVSKNDRRMDNWGLKANLAYIRDFGKWGKYTFNLSAAYTAREVLYKQLAYSIAAVADPREWHSGDQRLRQRYYWTDDVRYFGDVTPTSLFQRVVNTGGNSYTTSTQAITPRWVLNDWSDRNENTKSLIFAFAGRYFGNKLIFSPGIRVDQQYSHVRNKPTSWGFLPDDPNWDGIKLDDRYWRPDAPADWKTLSYVPKNSAGVVTSSVPIPAFGNRPTTGGRNDVLPGSPQYANDRFRGDYNNPAVKQNIVLTNAGLTYHALPWLTALANYSEGYKPLDPARLYMDGSDAKPEIGVAYEGGFTLSLFNNRLTVTPRYYFNQKENRLGDPPTTSPINGLMGRRAWGDGNTDSRNNLGYSNVLGGDYFATKNNGKELEINGRITRGWRVMANFGTGQLVDYRRWKSTKAYVQSRKGEMLEVLKAAGGTLDTTQKQTNAGHPVADSPGLAIADPAVTDSMIIAAGGSTGVRTGAVNDYNNIWVQYDNIGMLADTVGIRRMSMKLFTDYSIQTGKLKGLRFGLGWQYVDKDIAGYRSGDTVANPSYNPALPISSTNRQWVDDPSVDLNTPIWVKRPSEWTGTIGYVCRLRTHGWLDGDELDIRLTIRNLTNEKNVYYQDDGVALRAPNGDLTQPNRVAVPSRIASFQRPINYELTVGLKF